MQGGAGAMEYIMSGKQCLKIDLDQLNKWKCRQLCPKAWLWKEGKGELQRGSGVAVEHDIQRRGSI